jgi:AAA+ superfamily predicted ATPase
MMKTDQQRFEELIIARHPCVSIVTCEEDHALSIIRQAAIELRLEMPIWSITHGVRDGLLSEPHSPAVVDTDHPAAALFHFIRDRATTRGIFVMLDLACHLKDPRTLRMLRDAIEVLGRNRSTIVLIKEDDSLPAPLDAIATKFDMSLPDEKELEELVKQTLREINAQQPVTVAMTRQGLCNVIRNLRGLNRQQVRQIVIDCLATDLRFDDDDINGILARKRQALSGTGLLQYVEAPTTLDEIGGLQHLKTWLCQRQNALSDEATAFGLPAPRGVLMLGVQGAGKSLSAKAVASAWQRPLLRMDVGALYDKYIGESERRLSDALKQAERMAPIILWIDEIEKAFASAASQSTDGGLSKRMFGSLLTWMQERTEPVFVIATANDIEALPPELLRKGRFDEIFFIDLPQLEAREQIFQIHLKKRNRDPKEFDTAALAEAAEGFSGAEIEQAVIGGMHRAFAAKSDLTTQHVLDALKESPPLSVTMAEKVEALRQWARGRCVLAD